MATIGIKAENATAATTAMMIGLDGIRFNEPPIRI
jgi:hypothetical protein